jgi:hypothetical protein
VFLIFKKEGAWWGMKEEEEEEEENSEGEIARCSTTPSFAQGRVPKN